MYQNDPELAPEAKTLLTSKGNRVLDEDQFLQLSMHLRMISSWADRVPASTKFFFINWKPILVLPRVEGYSREELAIAAYLQPLHSQLCAIAVQVLWKFDQLIRTYCAALNAGHLIVAATMARSLVEACAAFGCETHAITQLWRARKEQPAPGVASLEGFENETRKLIGQVLFGTKLKEDNSAVTGIERTNILTLIDRAERLSENKGMRQIYDVLCDVVHPSIGANRTFWTEEPDASQDGIFQFTMSQRSNGLLGNLPFAVGLAALWSLQWLGHMWVLFELTRNDICLTAKIFSLPRTYYGVISPEDPSGYCRCGSGKMQKACSHVFGLPSN